MARRRVPRKIARELRREAGFGCCVCGLPIYEYHHIVPWSVVKRHEAEDMMLLCPNCHDRATKGAFPEVDQRAAKAAPFNIARGYAKGQLEIAQDYLAIEVGTVALVGSGSAIEVDGEPLLAIRLDTDGRMRLTAYLYDEADRLIAKIVDNEWISGDPLPWDIESSYQELTLRAQAYDIRLKLDARADPVQLSGRFWRSKNRVELSSGGIVINGEASEGTRLSGSGGSLRDVAIVNTKLNIRSRTAGVIELGGGVAGAMYFGPDPETRLAEAIAAYRGSGGLTPG